MTVFRTGSAWRPQFAAPWALAVRACSKPGTACLDCSDVTKCTEAAAARQWRPRASEKARRESRPLDRSWSPLTAMLIV